MNRSVQIIVVLLVLIQSAMGQSGAEWPVADSLFRGQHWVNAVRLFEKLVKAEPSNGDGWLKLAQSRYSLKEFSKAAKAYEEAVKLQYNLRVSRYNLACCYALMGENAPAFSELEHAIDAGFVTPSALESDTDLAGLRGEKRYSELLERAKRKRFPCEYDEKYRALDFWIGEWDVFNTQGRKVGTNSIQRSLNSCMVFENWTDVFGTSGKSVNYVDPSTGKWIQNWVSATGGITMYEGEVIDGAMHFSGETITVDGKKTLQRAVLKPDADGRVKHRIENSADAGKNWTLVFDGMYVVKK